MPTMPWSRSSEAASRAAAPSLRRRLSPSASTRAAADGAVALGLALGVLERGDPGLDLGELLGGGLVGAVEALLALLVVGDGALEPGELAARPRWRGPGTPR